jgi:hypothetical protein
MPNGLKTPVLTDKRLDRASASMAALTFSDAFHNG